MQRSAAQQAAIDTNDSIIESYLVMLHCGVMMMIDWKAPKSDLRPSLRERSVEQSTPSFPHGRCRNALEKIKKSTGLTLLEFALEFLLEVLKQVGVEILTSQVGITSSSFDSENTTLDVEKGNIESSTTEIINQNISLLVGLSGTETVGNGSSSWLVDDTEDVETGDRTGILGGLTLVVVEVGGNGNNSLSDLLAQLNFGNFLHL
jgi:hypothetical protein